jgi:hypothetical protein
MLLDKGSGGNCSISQDLLHAHVDPETLPLAIAGNESLKLKIAQDKQVRANDK